MVSLVTCDGCGRKVSSEAAKAAGGKPLCPPCFEKVKLVVEEKRRKAAEEKKTAAAVAAKTKAEEVKVKAISRLAERGIAVEDVLEKPTILPPSDVIPALKKKSGRGEDEVKVMLGSAGGACLMARIAAIVLMVMAGLYAVIGGMLLLGSAAELGGAKTVLGGAALAAVVASLVVPALFLWFLGTWVKRFSALFAKQLGAEARA
jgi:hypothetical protein